MRGHYGRQHLDKPDDASDSCSFLASKSKWSVALLPCRVYAFKGARAAPAYHAQMLCRAVQLRINTSPFRSELRTCTLLDADAYVVSSASNEADGDPGQVWQADR